MSQTNIRLTKSHIKNIYNLTFYRRGLDYYNQGLVYNLEHNVETNTWHAKVRGSDDYDVKIELSVNEIISSCTCPAYNLFNECKHEIAVLLAIADRLGGQKVESLPSAPKNREYNDTNLFIESLSQLQYSTVKNNSKYHKKPLKVEFYLKQWSNPLEKDTNLLSISLKIGEDRLYIVKNIKQFLEDLENGQAISFSQSFTYDPSEHSFLPSDLEIITMLQDIARNELVYQKISSSHYGSTNLLEKRELLIPSIAIDAILDKLSSYSGKQELLFLDKNYIEINDSYQLPFNISLTSRNNNEFVLDLSELYNIVWFKSYNYFYYNEVFYKLLPEQQKLIKELNTFMTSRRIGYLKITKDQIEPFFSHVEPVLKKIGTVNIDSSITEQINAPDLIVKIFIDYTAEQLKTTLEYHYDERIIDPFQPKSLDNTSEQIILVRDIEKEQEIMNIIEGTSLKFNGKELYLDGEEELYYFLYHSLPLLEDNAEVYMTNSAKNLINIIHNTPKVLVELDANENWLEVGFDFEGIEQEEIHNILQSIIEKKRYYRLTNGSFISIEDAEFATINQLMSELEISKTELIQGKMKRPVFKGIQVAEIVGEGNKASIKYGKLFRNFVQHFRNPEQLDYEIPLSINAKLRDYQEYGFKWLKTLAHYKMGGILADDMGLGKTLQSIAFIVSEKEDKKDMAPVLIVTPASLVYNWRNEFRKFAPSINIKIIDGLPEERKVLIQDSIQADVWITSYPLLRQDIDLYQAYNFDVLILDEAQAIKNSTTKTFKAVQLIEANKRFALSGTPIENSINELWSIFQVVLPGLFSNKLTFNRLEHDKISRLVNPFILRRLKKDVLKELPDKIETVQVSELTREQKEIYLGYLEKIQKDARASIQEGGFNKNRIKILAGLTRLRQICNHPALFLENYAGESGKLEQLMELIESALKNKRRILIFSQFSSMLQMIRTRLDDEGYSCFYLDGDTPAKERVILAEQFNKEYEDIFLISLKAGGVGLNLTGADTVILFDLWWNPAVEEQATGRAHRIGQKKVVQVIRLITNGTIEEKIYEMQQKKKELIERIIQPGEEMFTNLTEEDIMELLSL